MVESSVPDIRRDWRTFWRNFFSLIFTRGFIFGVLLVGEAVLVFSLINNLFDHTLGVYISSLAFSIVVVVYLVSQRLHSAFKLAWVIFILISPPVGATIYLIYELFGRLARHYPKRDELQKILAHNLHQDQRVWAQLRDLPLAPRQQLTYLSQFENYPAYTHTQTHYFPLGEDFFSKFKQDLQTAEKFIFLEYYIIAPGEMWNEILEILRAKVAAGVEVRLMYDDFGSLFSLPTNYAATLSEMGIRTTVLNRFRPLIAFQMNNRDHRKIAAIDGRIGYTGGLNLADEYINAINRYGHWKDTAVRLEGDAVAALTTIFLQMWNSRTVTDQTFAPYLSADTAKVASDGFVQPFADDPMDNEHVGKNVYLNLINKAQKSLYLTTPYLVPDDELISALTLAAKNGVDVRLIIPARGDHWYVHMLSQAFCLPLIEAGVQVYEYTPGFIHSKTILADGEAAVIGSINLDYRSLYLLYESAVYIYAGRATQELEQDLEATFKQCRLVELADVKEIRWTTRLTRSLLRLIAPLV